MILESKKIILVTPEDFYMFQHFYLYKEYICNFGKYSFMDIFVRNSKLAYQMNKGFGYDLRILYN